MVIVNKFLPWPVTEVGRCIEIGAVQGQGGILKGAGTTFRTGSAEALLLFVGRLFLHAPGLLVPRLRNSCTIFFASEVKGSCTLNMKDSMMLSTLKDQCFTPNTYA